MGLPTTRVSVACGMRNLHDQQSEVIPVGTVRLYDRRMIWRTPGGDATAGPWRSPWMACYMPTHLKAPPNLRLFASRARSNPGKHPYMLRKAVQTVALLAMTVLPTSSVHGELFGTNLDLLLCRSDI